MPNGVLCYKKETMTEAKIFNAVKLLPESFKQEALNFILFLTEKLKYEEDKPVMKIPQFGAGKVKITMSPDFDEPLEDFKDYM
jgi:hypothetical protein